MSSKCSTADKEKVLKVCAKLRDRASHAWMTFCVLHTLTHILWIGKCSFFRHSELKSLHSTDYRTFTGPKKGKCWEFLETAVPGWRHWDGSSTLEMVCTLGRGGRVSFAHLYLISALTQTRKQRKIGLMLAVIDTYSSLAVTLFLFHVPQTNHL